MDLFSVQLLQVEVHLRGQERVVRMRPDELRQ